MDAEHIPTYFWLAPNIFFRASTECLFVLIVHLRYGLILHLNPVVDNTCTLLPVYE